MGKADGKREYCVGREYQKSHEKYELDSRTGYGSGGTGGGKEAGHEEDIGKH